MIRILYRPGAKSVIKTSSNTTLWNIVIVLVVSTTAVIPITGYCIMRALPSHSCLNFCIIIPRYRFEKGKEDRLPDEEGGHVASPTRTLGAQIR